MKQTRVVRSLVFLCCVACVVQTASEAQAGPPPLKPDLVITSFALDSWGACVPGQPVFTFAVTVKNQGKASWSGVEPVVLVRDLHPHVMDNWGTGIGVDPPLQPGQTRRLLVTINYFANHPNHMTLDAPHPFQAVVNPNHVVAESDFGNNSGPGPAIWRGLRVIMVGAPLACSK